MSSPKKAITIRKVVTRILASVLIVAAAAAVVYLKGRAVTRAEGVDTPQPARPVRYAVVESREIGDPVIVSGYLRAREEISLAFRLAGKLIERPLDVGDRVGAGQVVARLDDEIERNARDAARADLIATQAALEHSEAFERRQKQLLLDEVLSHNDYDLAVRQLKTARAQVDAAKARLESAEEQLGYTALRSAVEGIITQKGAEPGEVVQAGQMILKLARQEARDAVFNMPSQVIREGLAIGQEVDVWLADNDAVATTGKIREISPEADPITRNYQVKIDLAYTPAGMFLGATVVGRLNITTEPVIEIPSPALTMRDGEPSVWVIGDENLRVHRRAIRILRYRPDSVVVTDGLHPGERIVTAGVHELHEGQTVTLLGDAS